MAKVITELNDELKAEIKQNILDSEKIVIGIGSEFDSFSDKEKEDSILKTYKKLNEYVKDKDYRIITLCMDELVYKVFDKDRIVAPCGNISFYQCDQNCNNKLYPTAEFTDEKICPDCGGKLVLNNIKASSYNESGYIDAFMDYKKWLQSTVNKKLLILELGVGMHYPTVIRLPFDKICYYNHKSIFYRVDDSIYQHTKENADRGISVAMGAVDFIDNI